MRLIRVADYQTQDGRIPYREWLNGLKDKKSRIIIERRIARFCLGNFGDFKKVGDSGLLECRIFFGPGFRVYFMFAGAELVVLLCGGDKGSQKRDISKAMEYALDYWRNA